MKSVQQLNRKAEVCLSKKADIPMSPLFNMAKTATGSGDSNNELKYLQNAVDYLTCKAKEKIEFNNEDKEFLKEMYEAFWWGGQYRGYKEAAQLANYYVNGEGNNEGNPLIIEAEIYKTSTIVIATMRAMKQFLIGRKNLKQDFYQIRCDNAEFRSKPYARSLLKMNYRTEGKMKSNGVLEVAQNNHRLHNTDGHFYLQAISLALPNKGIKTVWRVDSLYDFEPFEKHDYYTNIPLGRSVLKLPDGLSEYMTKIGVAKAFWYRAEWIEIWQEN